MAETEVVVNEKEKIEAQQACETAKKAEDKVAALKAEKAAKKAEKYKKRVEKHPKLGPIANKAEDNALGLVVGMALGGPLAVAAYIGIKKAMDKPKEAGPNDEAEAPIEPEATPENEQEPPFIKA